MDKVKLPKAKANKPGENKNGSNQVSSDLWKLIGSIIAILLFFFIIMGGVNQVKFIKATSDIANAIGKTIKNWITSGSVDVNNNGIYWRP